MVYSAYFVKSIPHRAFSKSFFMLSRYVTDILKMSMKKFNAEKKNLDKVTGFDLHIAGGTLQACLQQISWLICTFVFAYAENSFFVTQLL